MDDPKKPTAWQAWPTNSARTAFHVKRHMPDGTVEFYVGRGEFAAKFLKVETAQKMATKLNKAGA